MSSETETTDETQRDPTEVEEQSIRYLEWWGYLNFAIAAMAGLLTLALFGKAVAIFIGSPEAFPLFQDAYEAAHRPVPDAGPPFMGAIFLGFTTTVLIITYLFYRIGDGTQKRSHPWWKYGMWLHGIGAVIMVLRGNIVGIAIFAVALGLGYLGGDAAKSPMM